jgi:hypothetical protein
MVKKNIQFMPDDIQAIDELVKLLKPGMGGFVSRRVAIMIAIHNALSIQPNTKSVNWTETLHQPMKDLKVIRNE